ncbi:MAG: LptA/OstA family protein [Myxococcota bacterium]
MSASSARAAEVATAVGSGLRIAIAPFVGEEGDEAISQLLAVRFERLGVERLRSPGSFAAEREFDPRAEVVRTWAQQAEVDSIVVGRIGQVRPRSEVRQVEAVVRSGHSGAELFRHAVLVPARAGLGSALDQLAAAIVRDLGGDPLVEVQTPTATVPPPVSAGQASEVAAKPEPRADAKPEADAKKPKTDATTGGRREPGTGAEPSASKPAAAPQGGVQSGGGLQTRIGVAKFRSDAPIEIKADQAEIMAEGEGRRLVFQGRVWVKQDNVVVTSDHLEAEYVEGESEPSRLLAKGSVHVEQGNRGARCDRAEYLRATSQLTCRGHAELVQGCDVVRGEVIVLDLGADKARVEGAASIVINPKENTDPRCAGTGGRS